MEFISPLELTCLRNIFVKALQIRGSRTESLQSNDGVNDSSPLFFFYFFLEFIHISPPYPSFLTTNASTNPARYIKEWKAKTQMDNF